LHLVLGPSAEGKPVRFVVTVDGKAPGVSHGIDVDAVGQGVVTAQRAVPERWRITLLKSGFSIPVSRLRLYTFG
jgi:hypothetical protein